MTEDVDVLVVGAGAAGLVAAISLAQAGCRVCCAGPADTFSNGRTVALFEGSLRHLEQIGAWPEIAPYAAPLRRIRMIDRTRPAFPVPSVLFSAGEIGLSAFGANVENDVLVRCLTAYARTRPTLSLRDTRIDTVEFSPEAIEATASDSVTLRAKLIVAADGRRSVARRSAKIAARPWTYPQTAITTLLAHDKPHRGTSTEFHTREGPCTLVPLNGREGAPHRSSLVWLMRPQEAERRRALADADFAAELERQVDGFLGSMRVEGARGVFPMAGMDAARIVGHRIALVGEAAHVFPPLAAQGLNLSLRDAAALAATIAPAVRSGGDPGAADVLAAYSRNRRGDVGVRVSGIDILNRSLLADVPVVDLVRSIGMTAFARIGPLRRAIMREGVLPFGAR